ncbi:MAG: MFS transporter [Myxococcales bacterium]|nr:MFS transporter [Myxococcales bacterium]
MARDLRLFYYFRLLATSYLWMPIFWRFMTERGLGFDEIMLLSALYSVVVIIVEVPTGALADRIGRRESMMAGSLALVASGVVAYFAQNLLVFAIAETLAAVSMSLCSGADSAYLYDLLAANGRSHEYARREGTASAWHQAGSAGAFAAGGLLGEIDLALPYVATAVVGLGAFCIAFAMRDEASAGGGRVQVVAKETSVSVEMRSYMQHMGEATRELMRSKRLLWAIAFSAVVFVLLRATIYLYQPYLNARGFGIAETGFVFAGVYLVATFVAQKGHLLRRRLGEKTLVWGLLGTLALSFVLLNQISGQWALCLLAVQAVANGLYSPLVKPLLNREISNSARRATMLSMESIARRVAMGVFSPIAGYYGASSAMYLCGGIGFVGIVLLALFVRHAHLHGRQRRTCTLPMCAPVAAAESD